MTKFVLACTAAVGLASAAGANDYGPPNPEPGKYGMFPALKGLFAKKCDTCGGKGCKGHAGPGGPYGPGMDGQSQGTLVFPQHPFVRSPRDYFMFGN